MINVNSLYIINYTSKHFVKDRFKCKKKFFYSIKFINVTSTTLPPHLWFCTNYWLVRLYVAMRLTAYYFNHLHHHIIISSSKLIIDELSDSWQKRNTISYWDYLYTCFVDPAVVKRRMENTLEHLRRKYITIMYWVSRMLLFFLCTSTTILHRLQTNWPQTVVQWCLIYM